MENKINPFLLTDVYKMGHMEQYPEGTTKVYSYLIARSGKVLPKVLWFGLQPLLMEYLSIKPEKWMVDEFLEYRKEILGSDLNDKSTKLLYDLVDLGYFPIKVKALEEGTVIPTKNVLMTLTNTHPDFPWIVGFFESMLLKVWNTATVASYDLKLFNLTKRFSDLTCDNDGHLPFSIHDFGYRGCSSEETAALAGMCHLILHLGTDTVPCIRAVKRYYGGATGPIGLSVPATEHSVMCAFGPENEFEAFENLFKLYPTGFLSIVSDTYNLWNVLTNFTDRLYDQILARDGRVVFRPDSGDPEKVICGDPSAPEGSPENKGALRILAEKFGTTLNEKGYKVLNPKVGLIYGDGMYYERFERILTNLQEMGFASSNLVVGIGGLLLQNHSRDEQGYAIKATYAEVNGEVRELLKDPVTDPGKRSHKGLIQLTKDSEGNFVTKDQCTWEEEAGGLLETVFVDGKITKTVNFDQVRANARK